LKSIIIGLKGNLRDWSKEYRLSQKFAGKFVKPGISKIDILMGKAKDLDEYIQ